MSLITWKDEYFFGIKEIDEQHQKILLILNKLYEIIEGTQDVSCNEVDEILKELTQYGMFHFGTEEWYFNKFDYNETDDHVAIHNQYRERLQDWEKKCSVDNAKAILIEMADYLKNWWEWHILKTDREYVEYFKSKGI